MDKRISREQLNILGGLPLSWWDESFISEEANRTYVLTRCTQVDTVAGLGSGYYVFVVYGEITPELAAPVVDPTKHMLTVTSASFFEDNDTLYCDRTAEQVARNHLNNLRRVHEIRMHAEAE